MQRLEMFVDRQLLAGIVARAVDVKGNPYGTITFSCQITTSINFLDATLLLYAVFIDLNRLNFVILYVPMIVSSYFQFHMHALLFFFYFLFNCCSHSVARTPVTCF